MNYWINSNTGDYITENNGQYKLTLVTRYNPYIPQEDIEITKLQFNCIKGFIPIKEKKLLRHRQRKYYAPTLEDGTKGKSERYTLPSVSELREQILKDILGK